MTRTKVVDLHPEPPAEPATLGLRWSAERTPSTRRWAAVGRVPGRTHGLAAVLEVKYHPAGVTAEEVARVFAQLANDMPEGAALLMAADLATAMEESK